MWINLDLCQPSLPSAPQPERLPEADDSTTYTETSGRQGLGEEKREGGKAEN